MGTSPCSRDCFLRLLFSSSLAGAISDFWSAFLTGLSSGACLSATSDLNEFLLRKFWHGQLPLHQAQGLMLCILSVPILTCSSSAILNLFTSPHLLTLYWTFLMKYVVHDFLKVFFKTKVKNWSACFKHQKPLWDSYNSQIQKKVVISKESLEFFCCCCWTQLLIQTCSKTNFRFCSIPASL